MTLLRRFLGGLRALLRRRRDEAELDEELRTFLELSAADKLRAGLGPEEARRAARLEMGSPEAVKDWIRDAGWESTMETFFRDLRFGLRMLRKHPGFAAIAVLTLALGIGANTAIFSVFHGVLLEPLPFPDPHRLVTLWSQEDWPYGTNGPEYFDLRERQTTLAGLAVYRVVGGNLSGQGDPVRVTAAAVTAGFFPVLGVEPMLGRAFGEEEDQPGKDPVAVLRHGFWQRQLGGDPKALGRTLSFDGISYTVIGVMPPGFAFPDGADLWLPAALDPANPAGRTGHGLGSVARLRPGVSLDQASEDVRRISRAMHEEHPEAYPERFRSGWTLRVEPLQASLVGDVQPALLALLGAVGLVLLIACVNVANLLLARGTAREREITVRAALGASRGRLVRQLLTESVLLSLLGGAVGLGLAFWGLDQLVGLAPQGLPRLAGIGISAQVLAFVLAVSVATSLLFGLAPALFAVRGKLDEPLRNRAEGSAGPGREHLRGALVVLEVALTLVLLIGAGLLLRSFSNLRQVDLGFRTEQVLTVHLTLPRSSYPTAEARASFYDGLLARVGALPGVEAAGAISVLPLSGDFSFALMAEGMAANFPESYPHGLVVLSGPRAVTPGYFRVMGIALLAGRLFEESDRGDAPLVVMVSDDFAREAWPDAASVVGKRIAFPTSGEAEWRTVVGMVRDVRDEKANLAGRRYKDVYFPHAQQPAGDMFLTLRTAAEPTGLVGAVRGEVEALDPTLPLYEVRTMAEVVAHTLARPRLNALLMALFAAMATVLGAVGIYGVISYGVSQRTHEIGVRLALGAQPGDILRQIVGRGMVLVAAGLALGLAGAVVLTRWLESQLFGVAATDWAIYGAVAGLLAAVALAACYLPARRAMAVDTATALRYE